MMQPDNHLGWLIVHGWHRQSNINQEKHWSDWRKQKSLYSFYHEIINMQDIFSTDYVERLLLTSAHNLVVGGTVGEYCLFTHLSLLSEKLSMFPDEFAVLLYMPAIRFMSRKEFTRNIESLNGSLSKPRFLIKDDV